MWLNVMTKYLTNKENFKAKIWQKWKKKNPSNQIIVKVNNKYYIIELLQNIFSNIYLLNLEREKNIFTCSRRSALYVVLLKLREKRTY